LADIGWSGAPGAVALGMNATLAARYSWIGPALLAAVVAERPVMNRRPIAEAVPVWAATVPFLVAHAEQAREAIAVQARER
jgi:hypothetical protein